MQQGDVNLAGPVKVLSDGGFKAKYGALFMTPAETRAEFERLGWSRVAAFQTRNPMHRSHEYLAKVAIETCDGVLVHSLLGALKAGDIPAEVRTRAIGVLMEKYFRSGTVVQAGYPLDMRYAGPREALLHALFRQNYGCSHQIVGRDHAGVGSYYGPFDAHRIFDEIPQDALETQPLKMDVTFWCYKCGGMASGRTCAHGDADRLQVSGTQLRKWLSEGSPGAGRVQPARGARGAAGLLRVARTRACLRAEGLHRNGNSRGEGKMASQATRRGFMLGVLAAAVLLGGCAGMGESKPAKERVVLQVSDGGSQGLEPGRSTSSAT